MSIQLSVIIWTVICFLLLMVILHNWLFKPVLEVMEKRRSRIENAKAKQIEAQKLLDEHEKMLIEKKKDFEKSQKAELMAEIEKIQAESKNQVESAKVSRLNTYEVYCDECSKEYSRIISTAEASTKQIAETFADRLINQPRNSGIN